jgi:hypothetical protein
VFNQKFAKFDNFTTNLQRTPLLESLIDDIEHGKLHNPMGFARAKTALSLSPPSHKFSSIIREVEYVFLGARACSNWVCVVVCRSCLPTGGCGFLRRKVPISADLLSLTLTTLCEHVYSAGKKEP